MQRATISVSEGRFPEAHFDNRHIMEPSIGYALTRLCAQARMRGTGIHVEVDDTGTRLSLVIDAEGRLHTPRGARAPAGAPTEVPAGAQTEARSDASAPTRGLPITAEGSFTSQHSRFPRDSALRDGAPRGKVPSDRAPRDHRRTFTSDGGPSPALTPPIHQAHPRTEVGGTEVESATPGPLRDDFGPTREHSNSATAPQHSQATPRPQARRRPQARPGRGRLIATVILATLALCGAALLLT